MGFIFSKILDFFSRSRSNFKIIILGIQNAGKTTILYRLSLTRSVWDVYFVGTDAIIYVIDTHDTNYEESKNQFYKLLENEALKNAIILIYANKQDLSGAKSVNEIIQIYEFNNIKDHVWNIQPCSAQTGEGLITGMKWLSDQLVFRSNNNFPVNPYVDFPEDKNSKKNKNGNKKNKNGGQSLNNSEANLGNTSVNQNTVGNINNTTNEEKK